ncbi:MAG: general stress protein [bacterium]|nr:general stress protein [bacterium]
MVAEMEETKREGSGWHGDPEGHAEAGRKGGEKTASERGPEFYSEIGRKGGEASPTKFEKGSERARQAGRKGGQN